MIPAGSKVKIHYRLRVDGETLDTSEGGEPLAYTQGSGEIIEGLEEGLAQLEEGAQAELSIPPEKGYGSRDPEAVQSVAREAFQEPQALTPGMLVQAETGKGRVFQATVSEVQGNTVTLDLNHPLAGKTLQFTVEILEVIPPA